MKTGDTKLNSTDTNLIFEAERAAFVRVAKPVDVQALLDAYKMPAPWLADPPPTPPIP